MKFLFTSKYTSKIRWDFSSHGEKWLNFEGYFCETCASPKGSILHTFWLVKIQDFWEPLNREIERPSVAPHRLTNDFHLKLKQKKSSSHGIHAWYGINGIIGIYTYIWLNFMVNVGNKCM